MTAPLTSAPEWAASQASPWTTVNKSIRIFDAFSMRTVVQDRDLTAPPVSCSDGDRYLIAAGATGDWSTHDGELAIAVGDNASNGWYFAVAAREGVQIWIVDEAAQIEYLSGMWVTSPERITTLGGLSDVSLTGINDFDLLIYDLSNSQWYPVPLSYLQPESIGIAISDETTALTVGTAKVTMRMPFAMVLSEVRANVNTAPAGSTIIVDINEEGVSILSTKLTIDAGEKTSKTAATPAVISDPNLADDAEITIDIDQVGSGTAGKGLKVWLIGRRA